MNKFLLSLLLLVSVSVQAKDIASYDFTCTILGQPQLNAKGLVQGSSWDSLHGNYYGSLNLLNKDGLSYDSVTVSKSASTDMDSRDLGYTRLQYAIPDQNGGGEWLEVKFDLDNKAIISLPKATLTCYRLNGKIEKL